MSSFARRLITSATLLAAGCAAHGDDDMGAAVTAVVELPPTASTATSTASGSAYVTLESRFDTCEDAGAPGAIWVREVNGEKDARRVTRLDVSALSREALAQAARAARGELVLQGTFSVVDGPTAGPFVVVEAWRGLPGVDPLPEDAYLAVVRGDGHLIASELNRRWEHHSLETVALPNPPDWLDVPWLTTRVLERGAVVAGQLDGWTLHAHQVFVHLPDVVGPCGVYPLDCRKGIATFERDENRCLVPTGCATPGPCPLYLAQCDPGYLLAWWPTQPRTCLMFRCDPAFLSR
jgi:hypothetical protein